MSGTPPYVAPARRLDEGPEGRGDEGRDGGAPDREHQGWRQGARHARRAYGVLLTVAEELDDGPGHRLGRVDLDHVA